MAPTLFPTGGAMSVSRDRFLAMGGFDELYYPAYWEDVDLGYRAWKNGFVNLFQPESVMYHMKAASWSKENQDYVRAIDFRNGWLFIWRNISDPKVLAVNLAWTIRYYIGSLKRNDRIMQRAFKDAALRLPAALKHRHMSNGNRSPSDRAICKMANSHEIGVM